MFRGTDKKLRRTKLTLIRPCDGYVRPVISFDTTTTVWRVDELIKKRVRDWMELLGEDGYEGTRSDLRQDVQKIKHKTGAGEVEKEQISIYTGTYSVFPVPLMEYILVRYGPETGGKLLDAFSGGPSRGYVSAVMGYEYHGCDISKRQIDENLKMCKKNDFKNVNYYLSDARNIDSTFEDSFFDVAVTCPPYYNLEVYSDDPNDLSNFATYGEFSGAMLEVACGHKNLMKEGAFVCIVVGNFRDKKTGELIDFRGDTVRNFREAGFVFWQDVILSKNFGSAAKRGSTSWKGQKLVPIHEHLLVFRNVSVDKKAKRKRTRLYGACDEQVSGRNPPASAVGRFKERIIRDQREWNEAIVAAAKIADSWSTSEQREFGNGGPGEAIRKLIK
jgi:hypothetical protein